jgi:hypothetical protein
VSQNRETRATLRDFLRERDLAATSVSLSPNPKDTDPTDYINEGDDLGIDPNTEQPILGIDGLASAYIAYLTQQNYYTLSEQGEAASSITRGQGIARAEDQGASRVFAKSGTTLGQAMQLSNSGYQTQPPVSDYLDKTGADSTKSGNTLLSDVVGRPLDATGNLTVETQFDNQTQSGKMQQGTVSTIEQNSRKSPQNVTVPREGALNEVDDLKIQSLQRQFGKYTKEDGSSDAQSFSYDSLSDVAKWLLESAAGYTVSQSEPDSLDAFFNDASLESEKIGSVVQRLESKISNIGSLDVGSTRAENSASAPKQQSGESMRDDRGDFRDPEDNAVYTKPTTTTYTSETPAHDVYDKKHLKLAQARACYAVIKATTLFADTFNKIVQDKTPDVANKQPDSLKGLGPYYLGSSLYGRVNAYHRMLLNVCFVPTKNSYVDSVKAGMYMTIAGGPNIARTSFGQAEESPIFWNAITESAIKLIDLKTLPVDNKEQAGQFYQELGKSKAVRMMNVFATIGDITLQVTGKRFNQDTISDDIKQAEGLDFVDNLPVGPGTRISKSREGSGRSPLSLSWRGNSLPSAYLLSDDVVRSTLQQSNLLTGTSPLRGMLASSLVEKTYTDPSMRGDKARIPSDIVKIVEDQLDAEYVPFYFHDLRTNEIIAFHAFLESLQDSYAVNYNSYKTYGRADPVQTYADTSRSISLSFTVAATSREDFDEMWFKINKLITCVYPKYTPGQQVVTDNEVKFEQPFSQIIGATPLMRLRVGDVIKSNYSRFNLARIFGVGSSSTDLSNYKSGKVTGLSTAANATRDEKWWTEKVAIPTFYGIYGSPIKSLVTLTSNKTIKSLAPSLNSAVFGAASIAGAEKLLFNGFVNPIGYYNYYRQLSSPDNVNADGVGAFTGYDNRTIAYIKPRERPYSSVNAANEIDGSVIIRRPLKCIIVKNDDAIIRSDNDARNTRNYIDRTGAGTREARYIVSILEPGTTVFGDADSLFSKRVLATHDDLLPDLASVFSIPAFALNPITSFEDAVSYVADSVTSAVNLNVSSILNNAAEDGVAGFMSPNNNAVVRAFENNRGRGLAGVIKSIQFNWLDMNWEVDWGARAPMGGKITISFVPIHDLPPGLDASGYMRAPTYNVGSIMNSIAGDPYEDNGNLSKSNFSNKSGSKVTTRR